MSKSKKLSIITALPFLLLLSVGAVVAFIQYADHEKTLTEYRNVEVKNTVMACENQHCYFTLNTSNGIFTADTDIGSTIKIGDVLNFTSKGKEEHQLYVPFFKKTYRRIMEIK